MNSSNRLTKSDFLSTREQIFWTIVPCFWFSGCFFFRSCTSFGCICIPNLPGLPHITYHISFSRHSGAMAILFGPNIWEHAIYMLHLMHVLQKSHLMSQVKNQLTHTKTTYDKQIMGRKHILSNNQPLTLNSGTSSWRKSECKATASIARAGPMIGGKMWLANLRFMQVCSLLSDLCVGATWCQGCKQNTTI